ncbi:MAG: O-antigen ligase family protein [Bacteroidetes bacterium]|nr:O-antigen ligase family protein [Bacteroidota bacterium]
MALFDTLIFILSIIITQKLKHYWIIQKTYFLIPLTLISIIITFLFLFSIKNVPFIKERYSQHNYEIKMFETKQYKPEDLINFTSVRRIISWENGIELIKKHPIFGTGIGDYEEELKKEYDTDNYNLPINHHSQYLFIIGSVGIFIFIIYLLSLLYASFLFFKQKEILPIGIAFLMFYLVAFIPDAVLLRQVDCMSYSLFFSLLLSKIK